MTAEPILTLVAELLATHRLDAVMIGNAAAALQGSPVTTLDIDFMFQKTPGNLKKLKALARDVRFGAHAVRVASLEDIIRSTSVADRPQDRAVIPVLEETLREKAKGS